MKSFRSVNVYNNPNLSPPFGLQHTTASRKTYQGPRKRHVRQQSTWWEDESSSEGTFRREGTGETLTPEQSDKDLDQQRHSHPPSRATDAVLDSSTSHPFRDALLSISARVTRTGVMHTYVDFHG